MGDAGWGTAWLVEPAGSTFLLTMHGGGWAGQLTTLCSMDYHELDALAEASLCQADRARLTWLGSSCCV